MNELDAKTLERLQSDWAEIADKIIGQSDRSFSAIERVVRQLQELGLDMAADETYELLAPDMTKAAFEETRTYFALLQALDQYHQTQKISGRTYVDVYNLQHYHGLKRMIEYALPTLEKALAQTGMPADATSLMQREAQFVLEIYRDGTLENDMRRSAQEAACDQFRNAVSYAETVKNNEAKGERSYRASQEGLSHANSAIELAHAARGFYRTKDIPKSYGSFGGWDKSAGTIAFSREAAAELRRFFLVKELGTKFAEAREWQKKGHYVLDASGSGHGMMVLPMQDILLKLQEYGHDIRDAKTFAAIGTDIDTFWECYRQERLNAANDNDFQRLARPEFRR